MKKTIILIISALSLVSCSLIDDFLDVEPSKNTDKTIENVDQLESVIVNYGNYFEEHNDMAMASDDFRMSAKIHSQKPYVAGQLDHLLWNTENTSNYRYYAWYGEYQKVYYANLVLDYLDKVSGSDEKKAELKAEAHFLRAYCFFQIALAHTLYYDGSNGDELGITLKQSPSFEESLKRASLKDTWDFIDGDLQEALKIENPLYDSEGRRQTWRATNASVKAFMARYYLYRADYDNAKKYALAALDEYSDMKDYNNPSEMYHHETPDIYTINVGTPQQETITIWFPYTKNRVVKDAQRTFLTEWTGLYYVRTVYDARFWFAPSEDLVQTFYTDVPEGNPNNDLRYYFHLLPDFGLRSLTKTTEGREPGYCQFFYSDIISGPTTAEMCLIAAEVLAREGKVSEAMEYVEKVRKNRIVTAVYTPLQVSSQKEAIKKILQERRREMPFSIRWYDMKRLNANDPDNQITVTREFFEYNTTTVMTDKPKTYTLEPGSRRYALPIYNDEIANTYGEVEQNKY